MTGGAGFVGANLSTALATRHSDWDVVALDNLKRRGAELNLPRLRGAGVRFLHGDVRQPADLAALDRIDALVECSAEPSVLAGVTTPTEYPIHTNILGAYHALELARRDRAHVVFLSTSRVYPVALLNSLVYSEGETRFGLEDQDLPGVSQAGISEAFPLEGPRTLYGATKLAGELLIEEYAASFGVTAVVDRCGVIAGPWQMGKVDQGVFTHWMLSHHFGLELDYIGFGGTGKQVRDLLHVDDLAELIELQLLDPEGWDGQVLNVGGGRKGSLSLLESTAACRELTGREMAVGSIAETRAGDVPLYVSDCAALFAHAPWRPSRSAARTLSDVAAWIRADEERIAASLGLEGRPA